MIHLLRTVAAPRGLSFTLLAAALLGAIATAHADVSAALVVGRAAEHHRQVVRAALEDELREAGWALGAVSATATADLASCFSREQPRGCLAATSTARHLARVIAIRVEREPGRGRPHFRLTGQLSVAGASRDALELRYCGPCADAQLAIATRALAQRLLVASQRTDDEDDEDDEGDQARGEGEARDAALGAAPTRDEDATASASTSAVAAVAAVAPVAATWATEPDAGTAPDAPDAPDALSTSRARSRRKLGWALTATGAALALSGASLWALDEDPRRDPSRVQAPTYLDSAPAGVALLLVGGAALASGLYLLFEDGARRPRGAATSPHIRSSARRPALDAIVVPTRRGGATLGLQGTF
ncbi:MAG: hypothetical protein R3B48_18685 [Kofleriaceae bacterium]